jgi:methylenetetrahydrofolate reductase (NADPH)
MSKIFDRELFLIFWPIKKITMDIIFGNKFPFWAMLNFFDSFFKFDNDREKMNFSLEIGPHTDLETLPPVKDVYVTMLPGGDYKETADKSGDLVKKGFNPVPHFPARSIKNEDELKNFVSRCKDQGVKQALVIGGSREPIGKFDSSYQILETGFFEGIKIGIAGHPEGSPDIPEQNLEKAMIDKKPYADYIVTQWLLDSQSIVDFISKQSVPVHIGITGPMKISSLIKFANIVGAKNSINFLKSNFTKALDLLKPKDPNELIGKVKEFSSNFHIYTFGGLKETNKWLKENGYV